LLLLKLGSALALCGEPLKIETVIKKDLQMDYFSKMEAFVFSNCPKKVSKKKMECSILFLQSPLICDSRNAIVIDTYANTWWSVKLGIYEGFALRYMQCSIGVLVQFAKKMRGVFVFFAQKKALCNHNAYYSYENSNFLSVLCVI